MPLAASRPLATVLVAALLSVTAGTPAEAITSGCAGGWQAPQTTCMFDFVGPNLSVFGTSTGATASVRVSIVEPRSGRTLLSCLGEGGGGFAQCGAAISLVPVATPNLVPTPGMTLECLASGFTGGHFECWSEF